MEHLVKVAFQGQRGSYAEAAAAWMYRSHDIATVPCPSAADVVEQITSGRCQVGVIRLQNGEWGINVGVLCLLRDSPVHMIREVRFHERYNLAGRPGARIEGIRRVYAHPAILHLCSHFAASLKDVEIIARYDSAEVLSDLVQRGDANEAIICSDFAAGIFGLNVLKPSVESSAESLTRFVTIGTDYALPDAPAEEIQTAVLFELDDQPGKLMQALTAFSDHSINITAISARPYGGGRWDYMTFVEFSGAHNNGNVQSALNRLRETTSNLQVLGSYVLTQPPEPHLD
jgi:prephenate dehydratase